MSLVVDNRRRLKIFLNSIILIFSFIIFTKRQMVIKETSFFENLLVDTFAPIQRGVKSIHSEVTGFFTNYLINVNASKENDSLRNKINDLEGKLFELDEIEKENIRLKQLMEFGSEISHKKILAQVVAWDASSDFRVIRINKGFKDGVRLQAPVVTADGLVGYIYRLTDHFADILTLLDSSNRVDGIIQRVRTHGIVEGYSFERCLMKYVSRTEPIILNDVVITSGLGNIYPKGIRVGTVSRIERESYGITQHVEVTPVVDFGTLEEVAVLVGQGDEIKKKEWEALDKMDEESDK